MHGPGPHLTLKDHMIQKNRELNEKNEALVKENLELQQKLAHAHLKALLGWKRYDEANKAHQITLKQLARKNAEKPLPFLRNDMLEVINIDDCEEGMRLGETVKMCDRTSDHRDFIIVERDNGRQKQLEKFRFQHKVFDLAICEIPWLQLKPNRLYRFKVHPKCEQCLDIERKLNA